MLSRILQLVEPLKGKQAETNIYKFTNYKFSSYRGFFSNQSSFECRQFSCINLITFQSLESNQNQMTLGVVVSS